MNLSSIVSGILAEIASYDDYSMSRYEIDSKMELEILGDFLNGSLSDTRKYTVNDIDNNDKNLLKQIYDNLKGKIGNVETQVPADSCLQLLNPDKYGKEEYLNALKSINKDNIFRFASYDRIAVMFNNNILTDKEKKDIFKFIAKILIDKAIEMELEPEEIKELKYMIKSAKTLDDYENTLGSISHQLSCKRNEYEIQKELKKIKNSALNPNDNRSELQKYAEEYWVENKGRIKVSNNFGIGIYYWDADLYKKRSNIVDVSVQKTGNCWAMAGINSMGINEGSRSYMNAQIYKDSIHGVYVVQLTEAKNKGFGKDGQGIYFITDTELWRTANISYGDYDVAAYNLAIKKYFEESGEDIQDNDKLNGNKIQRFYEISRGVEAQEFDESQIPEGVGVYNVYEVNEDGYNLENKKKNDEELSKLYDSLINHFKNGGEIVLGAKVNIGGHGLHALSVVGVKDGKFIIQESNNDKDFAKQFEGSYLDENNTWNILLDKEDFIKMLVSVATNKF